MSVEALDGGLEEAEATVVAEGFGVRDEFADVPEVHVVPSIGFDDEFGGAPEGDFGLEVANDE